MTSVVGFLSADGAGSSAYTILSDSRETVLGSNPPQVLRDDRQKTFFHPAKPYIAAFSGTCEPAIAAIAGVMSMMDEWFGHIPPVNLLGEAECLIAKHLGAVGRGHDVSILHASCDGGLRHFKAGKVVLGRDGTVTRDAVDCQGLATTRNNAALGTGALPYAGFKAGFEANTRLRRRQGKLLAGEIATTLAAFISSGEDPWSGGMIQGVTLDRNGCARPIAFREGGAFYLAGRRVPWEQLHLNHSVELRTLGWGFLSHRDGDLKGRWNKGRLGPLDPACAE